MANLLLYAHTPPDGSPAWHGLRDHLLGTSQRAAAFAEPFGAAAIAKWAALCHDVGKSNPEWQRYLQRAHELGLDRRAARGLPRPQHARAGAYLALEHDFPIVAAAVYGHHGGMPARPDLKQLRATGKEDPAVAVPLRSLSTWLPEASSSAPTKELIPVWAANDRSRRALEALGRVVFSCVVDADYLDTEAHFKGPRKPGARLEPGNLMQRLDEHRSQLRGGREDVQRAREQVYRACLRAASAPQGFFRLAAPTGSGKTLAALGFALTHAATHHLDRIIVALPYTTITDQTAQVYRDVFGAAGDDDVPLVLEHHSALEPEEREDQSPAAQQSRLAAENWDAPLVVTTTVQFFESLFSNRPGRCRKLHNIARSVVVLDEVQTLPVPLLEPTVSMLRELVDHFGASVLLSTATQPALESDAPHFGGLPNGSVRDILPDAAMLFKDLRRVTYEVATDLWTWEQAALALRGHPRALAIVNTRHQALALLDALGDGEVLHLSTWLCGAHRLRVLAEVKRRLDAGEPCTLVATQVVEAGVDLDFPVVLRALGPLDRIVQAAGRCNREGRLPGTGKVVVFEPEEATVPRGVYATATEETRRLLRRPGADLHDPALYEEYFRAVYRSTSTDAHGIQQLRSDLDYPEVAARYRIITEDMQAVVVPYEDALRRLAQAESSAKTGAARMLQPFTVNLWRRDLERLAREGLVKERPSGFYEWTGAYDTKQVGIGRFGHDPEGLIIG